MPRRMQVNPDQNRQGNLDKTGEDRRWILLEYGGNHEPEYGQHDRESHEKDKEEKQSSSLVSTRPAMSPTVWPRFLMETTSDPKSCTAPISIDPNSTQSKAGTHPQITATAGPTIGPVPAIEVK